VRFFGEVGILMTVRQEDGASVDISLANYDTWSIVLIVHSHGTIN
jgi:hypothetical protein